METSWSDRLLKYSSHVIVIQAPVYLVECISYAKLLLQPRELPRKFVQFVGIETSVLEVRPRREYWNLRTALDASKESVVQNESLGLARGENDGHGSKFVKCMWRR